MLKLKKFFFSFFIFFLANNIAYSDEKILYIDMEYVIKNSEVGKSIFTKISEQNNKNLEKLKKREDELKKIEESIKKKQNILSEEEFKKEVNDFRTKVQTFRAEKDEMVKYINDLQKKEISNLYAKINPIIQNYMEKNNIEIILDVKNIIIGKSTSNITQEIIKDINNKLN